MSPVLSICRLLLQEVQHFLGLQPHGWESVFASPSSGAGLWAPQTKIPISHSPVYGLGKLLHPPWPKFPQPWSLLFLWELREASDAPNFCIHGRKSSRWGRWRCTLGLGTNGLRPEICGWHWIGYKPKPQTEISFVRATDYESSSVTNSFLSPFLSAARYG